MTELLTMKDLKTALKCSDSFVKKLVAAKEIRTVKVGRRRYARREDFELFISDRVEATN